MIGRGNVVWSLSNYSTSGVGKAAVVCHSCIETICQGVTRPDTLLATLSHSHTLGTWLDQTIF
jgi:hypothetical protein